MKEKIKHFIIIDDKINAHQSIFIKEWEDVESLKVVSKNNCNKLHVKFHKDDNPHTYNIFGGLNYWGYNHTGMAVGVKSEPLNIQFFIYKYCKNEKEKRNFYVNYQFPKYCICYDENGEEFIGERNEVNLFGEDGRDKYTVRYSDVFNPNRYGLYNFILDRHDTVVPYKNTTLKINWADVNNKVDMSDKEIKIEAAKVRIKEVEKGWVMSPKMKEKFTNYLLIHGIKRDYIQFLKDEITSKNIKVKDYFTYIVDITEDGKAVLDCPDYVEIEFKNKEQKLDKDNYPIGVVEIKPITQDNLDGYPIPNITNEFIIHPSKSGTGSVDPIIYTR